MDSDKIFTALKSLLEDYEPHLSVVHNKRDHYYLNTQATETNKKVEFFAAVQIKKNYVAFHLMPVYYYPELLENISQELKNRMQGKSCFNFKDNDDKPFAELKSLTKSAYEKYQSVNKI